MHLLHPPIAASIVILCVLQSCGDDASSGTDGGGIDTGVPTQSGGKPIATCEWGCLADPAVSDACFCSRRVHYDYGCVPPRMSEEGIVQVDECPMTPCCYVIFAEQAVAEGAPYDQAFELCNCNDDGPAECSARAQGPFEEGESVRIVSRCSP